MPPEDAAYEKERRFVMRRFKRKINRGLLLGAVLLLGLAVFVIVGEVRFRQQVPDIRKTVQAYVNSLPELNTLPADGKVGEVLTPAQKEEQNRKLETFLETYWANGEGSGGLTFSYSAADFRAYAQKLRSAPIRATFRDFSVLVPEQSITVKAAGAGYATVSVAVGDFNVLCTGDAYALLCGLCDGGTSAWEDTEPGGGSPEESNPERRVSYRMMLNFEMKRVGGEWKIVSVGGYCAPGAEYEDVEVIG